ncbi:MAG: hypothetical protein GY707_17670 [Desulfobacteraceae bacterium]|nr:hypothetical protein [Desulfobacteraceae bacterium]
MTDQTSVVPVKVETTAEAGKDPLSIMIDIIENEKISEADKTKLIKYAQTRFTNRRRMAYVALYALVLSLALLFVAAFIDGFSTCPSSETCKGILSSIKESQTLIVWIEGFLTAIVAAYFGISAWRPAS